MRAHFNAFGQAFKSSRIRCSSAGAGLKGPRFQFVCRSCQHKFSTSSIIRKIAQASKRIIRNASTQAREKEKRYPSRLLIYDTGETLATFVRFWKATALFQFGACTAWFAPLWYLNEKQSDPTIRTLQAIGITIMGAIPTLTLSYATAPFVRRVYLSLPRSASHSRHSLLSFARKLPADTRLEFQTLRIWPMHKHTTVFLSELRALPASRFRYANIELPKSEAWKEAQKQKSWARRVWEVLKEPRWKFYVKEGKTYTVRSGVPGVWEEVAKRIGEQTVREGKEKGTVAGKSVRRVGSVRPTRVVREVEKREELKRQTARSR